MAIELSKGNMSTWVHVDKIIWYFDRVELSILYYVLYTQPNPTIGNMSRYMSTWVHVDQIIWYFERVQLRERREGGECGQYVHRSMSWQWNTSLFSSYLAFVFVFVFVFVFWFALSLADVCTVQFSDSQTPNPFLYNGSFESLNFFAFWSWETDSNICMSTGHCPASSVQCLSSEMLVRGQK